MGAGVRLLSFPFLAATCVRPAGTSKGQFLLLHIDAASKNLSAKAYCSGSLGPCEVKQQSVTPALLRLTCKLYTWTDTSQRGWTRP